ACFVKVFGIVFLGEARSKAAGQAREAPMSMLVPMALLLVACAWIGLLPTTLVPLLRGAVDNWAGTDGGTMLGGSFAPLGRVSLIGWLLLALLAVTGFCLSRYSRKVPRVAATWGCGFSFPAPRMQYTASSFADFLVRLFHFGLWSERHGGKVAGLLPTVTRFASHTPDTVLDRVLLPVFLAAAWLCRQLRTAIHNGVIAFYLLYIALSVVVLLALFIL
ncbi:MAG: hypothetical protein RQ722_01785, partial [Desulfuromonadales bacterium]|nr:hypothetical protein [Desulfuromonadales bacterium]